MKNIILLMMIVTSPRLFASTEFIVVTGQLRAIANGKVTLKIGDESLTLDHRNLITENAKPGETVKAKIYATDLKKN